MTGAALDVRDRIVAFKRSLAPRRQALTRAYADVTDHVRRAVDTVLSDIAAERPVVPEVNYTDISSGNIPDASRRAIRKAGCVAITDDGHPVRTAASS